MNGVGINMGGNYDLEARKVVGKFQTDLVSDLGSDVVIG